MVAKKIKKELNDELYKGMIRNARFGYKCKQKIKIIILRLKIIKLLKLFCNRLYNSRK